MSAEVPEPETKCVKCKEDLFRLDGNKDWRTVVGFKSSCKKGGPHTPEEIVVDWDNWGETLDAWTREMGN